MKRLALQVACVSGLVLGLLCALGWGATGSYPGALITITTVAFLVAGFAFGKLERRR